MEQTPLAAASGRRKAALLSLERSDARMEEKGIGSQVRTWFKPEKDMCFTRDEAVAVRLANGFFEVPSRSDAIEFGLLVEKSYSQYNRLYKNASIYLDMLIKGFDIAN